MFNFLAFSFDMKEFFKLLIAPWEWFFAQPLWVEIVVVIFGALGFYLFLRLFYKIVEAIMAIFQ